MMIRSRSLHLLLSLGAALGCAAGARAAEQYIPPEGGEPWLMGKVYLLATEKAPQARGAAVILWTVDKRHHRLQLYASGLEPGAHYSVWLLRSAESLDARSVAERFRLAGARSRLPADASGVVAFATSLNFAVQEQFAAIALRKATEHSRGGWAGGVTVLRGLLADMD